jgi:hypothetical protein
MVCDRSSGASSAPPGVSRRSTGETHLGPYHYQFAIAQHPGNPGRKHSGLSNGHSNPAADRDPDSATNRNANSSAHTNSHASPISATDATTYPNSAKPLRRTIKPVGLQLLRQWFNYLQPAVQLL